MNFFLTKCLIFRKKKTHQFSKLKIRGFSLENFDNWCVCPKFDV